MEWTFFRRPTADDPGTINLCYNALDVHLVRGAADQVAVRAGSEALTYAALLEQVGALAGALRGLGAMPEGSVGVLLADPVDELSVVLAAARIGVPAVLLETHAPAERLDRHRPHLLVTDTVVRFDAHTPVACVLRGAEPQDPTRDLPWDVALRAGRLDPAPCLPVPPGSPAYHHTSAVPVVAVREDPGPLGRALATLLDGGTVEPAGGKMDP